MIGRLTGTLAEKNPPQGLVDIGGIERSIGKARRVVDKRPK